MIVAKEFPNDVFDSYDDLFKKLKDNKSLLIQSKKMQFKKADSFDFASTLIDKDLNANKSESGENNDPTKLKVVSIINTTNLLDSHGDVHLKGIWNKTVRENKNMLLLDQHKQTFEGIITDDVKASVKRYSWKELGYNIDGETEALVFESIIDKDRNPYMFEQYAKGRVKNHSVGMRYVKFEIGINSDEKYYAEEKEIWDKYIDEVANREDAEKQRYIWFVSEAKASEGSAVVFGSNPITPTMSTENKTEPSNHSEEIKDEPTEVTHKENNINLNLFT